VNPDLCWAQANGGVGNRLVYRDMPNNPQRCHRQTPHCHCLEQTGAWGRHETGCPVQGKEEHELVNNGWHVVCAACWFSEFKTEPVTNPISYDQTCCCCRTIIVGTGGAIYVDTGMLADIIGDLDCEELHN